MYFQKEHLSTNIFRTTILESVNVQFGKFSTATAYMQVASVLNPLLLLLPVLFCSTFTRSIWFTRTHCGCFTTHGCLQGCASNVMSRLTIRTASFDIYRMFGLFWSDFYLERCIVFSAFRNILTIWSRSNQLS